MINSLTGWRSVFAGLALGALAAFGQEPYAFPILMLVGFAGAFWLYSKTETPKHAMILGWALGAGYFCHALQWIVSPFMVDVARHGWMAPFALVLLGGGLALFWAIAFGIARRLLAAQSWPLLITWSAVELIRAYIFTGFPWAMPSQGLVSSIAGQGLGWGGPYVMNAVLLAAALGLSWAALPGYRRLLGVGGAAAFAVLLFLPPPFAPAPLTEHTIRLVQPNAAQRDKWNPDLVPVFFERQLAFTSAAAEADQARPDLVLWSETAIPWTLDQAGPALQDIALASGGIPVALGVLRRDTEDYFNALAVLDAEGDVAQVYDKHHLVPFGEYMPFADMMSNWGIFGLANRLQSGYAAGPGAEMLDFGPLGKALPLICYEAVFAHDVNSAPERPDFLIQITNDAWFGKGAGPRQHLAQARMRAIEQGLPLARAANTGISAMIDPYGRVTASLGLNTAGYVDAALPAPLAPTLYSRTGDLPFAIVLLLGCAFGGIRRRKV